MAKAPDNVQDAVMDVGRLRSILKLAMTGDDDGGAVRLPIVIGLDNADEGVVSVARRGNPKKLRADLIKIVQKQGLTALMKPDPSRLYFGYGYTNADAEGVLQIDVNKKPAGADKLATKIFRRVRSAGFSDVVFHVNEDLDAMSDEEEAPNGVDAAAPAPAAAPAAAAPPPAPPPPPPAPPAQGLAQDLATAIRGIAAAGADAPRKAALAQMAGAANAALKSGDQAEAARLIAALQATIAQPAANGAPPATPTAPPQAATPMPPDKLLALFRDAKDDVDAGLNKLQEALRATGDEDLVRIAEYGLYGMTDGAGVGLMKSLFNLQSAKPDTRDALYAAARAAAEAFRTAVFADEAVDLVDNNPFGVVVGIKSKLGPALDAIANAA